MSQFRRYAPIGEGFSAAAKESRTITGAWTIEGAPLTITGTASEKLRMVSVDDHGDNFQSWYDSTNTDRWGFFGFAGSTTDICYLRNEVASGEIYLEAHDAGDVNRPLVHGDGDAGVILYYGGDSRLQTTAEGAEVQAASNVRAVMFRSDNRERMRFVGDTDHSSFQSWYDDTETDRLGFFGYVGAGGNDDFSLRNEAPSGRLLFSAHSAADAVKNVIVADPDADVELYYTGTQTFNTNSYGIDVLGSVASAMGNLQNTYIALENSGGTRAGFMGFQSAWSDNMYFVSHNHGRNLIFGGEDAGGTFRQLLALDPDGLRVEIPEKYDLTFAGAAAGAMRGESQTIADDATGSFTTAGSYKTCMLVTSFNATANAFFGATSTQAPVDYGSGSNVVFGSANPDTDGKVNIWTPGASTISIKNRMGSSRTFTLYSWSL